MTAIEDIATERRRQIDVEGWTPEHDNEHGDGDLAMAAACYSVPGGARLFLAGPDGASAQVWPWDWDWWKPKDARANLVRAGALIVAEIERLDRLSGGGPISRPTGSEAPAEHREAHLQLDRGRADLPRLETLEEIIGRVCLYFDSDDSRGSIPGAAREILSLIEKGGARS